MSQRHILGFFFFNDTATTEIYTEGSITGASRTLHLTQPAVSHALRRLREHFGDPLFLREGQRMRPTPLARSLVEPVRRALRGLDLALTEIGRFDPATAERHFVIGVRDVLESILLPPLMEGLAQWPSISVSTVLVDRGVLETELASGRLDASLDVRWPTTTAVRRERVLSDRMVVVARRGHPALAQGLDLVSYLQQQHVAASGRRAGTLFEDLELERQGLQRRVRLRCQHYFAACRVAAATDLLLTMPGAYARIANENLPNQIWPLPFIAPTLDSYIYWHADFDADPANQWLREHVRGAFAGLDRAVNHAGG
jgi:DNA-binding transcriptional LysR family regulator